MANERRYPGDDQPEDEIPEEVECISLEGFEVGNTVGIGDDLYHVVQLELILPVPVRIFDPDALRESRLTNDLPHHRNEGRPGHRHRSRKCAGLVLSEVFLRKGLSAYSELAEAALKMYHTDREGFELLAKKCWEKYGAD